MTLRSLFNSLAATAAVWLCASSSSFAATQTLFELGSSWRYLDTGVSAPAGWTGVSFVDSAWKQGSGPFGYGDVGIPLTTTVSFGPNSSAKYITTYFRKTFVLPTGATYNGAGATGYNRVKINYLRDDGVVVYVNGVEVFRDNMPAAPTAITSTTLAPAAMDGSAENEVREYVYDPGANGLRGSGQTNVLAVEVHQNAATSSDLSFDAAMALVTGQPCFGVVRPGVKGTFTSQERVIGTTIVHERPSFDPDLPIEGQDVDISWKTTVGSGDGFYESSDVDFITNQPLANKALGMAGFTAPFLTTWESEAIDVRNFSSIRVFADVQAQRLNGVSYSSDYIAMTVRLSQDGISYSTAANEVPWGSIGNAAVPAVTEWTDLVAEFSTKRAIVPTSASNPASTWRTAAFVDTAWPSGTKGAGYENAPGTSPDFSGLIDSNLDFKTQLLNTATSVYMRATFPALPTRDTFTRFQLRVRADDGFVAYLNDSEIARKNAPTTPAFDSSATAENPDQFAVQWEDYELTVSGTNNARSKISTTGTNVLAIHFMNAGNSGSDMLGWPILRVGKSSTVANRTMTSIDDGDPNTFVTIGTAGPTALSSGAIPDGTQSIRLKIVANQQGAVDRAFYWDNIRVTGVPKTADTFESYMLSQAPPPAYSDADRDAKADLDGDTIPNLVEYAFVTDPKVAAVSKPVNGTLTTVLPTWSTLPGGYVAVRFRIPGTSYRVVDQSVFECLDLTIRPQISFGGLGESDWQDPSNGVNYFQVFGDPEENNDGSVTVTCRTILPQTLTNKVIYVRVKVGLAYPSFLLPDATPCSL